MKRNCPISLERGATGIEDNAAEEAERAASPLVLAQGRETSKFLFSNILHTHTPGANPAVEEAALIHHENSSLCLDAPELAACRLLANLEGLFCPPFSPTDEPVTGCKDAEAVSSLDGPLEKRKK